MFIKILKFLFLAVLFQEDKVSSQQPPMPPSPMWNPYSWGGPYYRGTNNMWNDYYTRAHEVGRQFYRGFENSGAANMFHTGVALAHQFARQIQRRSMRHGPNGAGNRMRPNQGPPNPIYPPQPYRY